MIPTLLAIFALGVVVWASIEPTAPTKACVPISKIFTQNGPAGKITFSQRVCPNPPGFTISGPVTTSRP
jgi:hypothetical protein